MKFTTSWDDGYALDRRVAKLLGSHGTKGTFYVCPAKQSGGEKLSEADIRALASEHEIGAHSMTHPRLTSLTHSHVEKEMRESRQWVETVTQKPCTLFCYPYGDWNACVKHCARIVGFSGARTISDLQFQAKDPFALPTTLQLYPFPFRRHFTRWWHVFDLMGRPQLYRTRLKELSIPLTSCRSWQALARALFLHALKTQQPFFHLWGHSEELERYGLWHDLEKFLHFIQEHGDSVQHVPNSALLS